MFNNIAMKIKDNRMKEGNFSFEIPKKRFHLDKDLFPINYVVDERKEA